LFDHQHSKRHPLSYNERIAIVILNLVGYNRHEIARIIPCNINTVDKWIKHWNLYHNVYTIEGKGRKRKQLESTNLLIIEYANQQPITTSKQIKHDLNLSICTRTVRRRLNDAGLYGRIARSEYPFSSTNIRQRQSFANGYLNWTIDKWDTVIWSDEAHIELGTHGQHWVQRPIGAAFDSCYMIHRIPHPKRLSIWGCICSAGVGDIHIFYDALDAKLTRTILSKHLKQTAHKYFPNQHWWFQQDNDPKHKSKIVKTWIESNGIDTIEFPPYSPDLSPIENVWADLKRRVEQHNSTSLTDLERHVREEWATTDRNFLTHIVHSMPERCKLVLKHKGHKIHC